VQIAYNGVLATTVQPIDESAASRAGIRAVQVIMRRDAADLAELADLVKKGAVKPRLAQAMSLSEAKRSPGIERERENTWEGHPEGRLGLE